MRRNKNVAKLVAGKIAEKRLHIRSYDWLYSDEETEIKRMVESNPSLFDLVERLRLLVPYTEAAFRSLEDEPMSLELLPHIMNSDSGPGANVTVDSRKSDHS